MVAPDRGTDAVYPSQRQRRRLLVAAVAVMAVLAVTGTGTAMANDVLYPSSHEGTATVAQAAGRAGTDGPGGAPAPAGIAADADTYVVAEQPATAYGQAARVTAAHWTGWHSEAYLRFTVPAPPAGQAVVRARVEATLEGLIRMPSTVELRTVTGAWSESTTYASRPRVGAVLSAVKPTGESLSFDVTAAVRTQGAVSFAMTNPTAQSVVSVHAREHGSDGPRLVLEYGPVAGGGRTLCGVSFNTELPGESYQQAFTRINKQYDGVDTVRVFYPGLPQPWPGKLDAGTRPMTVSFKTDPAEVLTGTHDVRLREWLRTAPRAQDIYWSYYHEPEDDIASGRFTAAQYRQAWQRISGLAREARNPRLKATLILMGWSLDPPSGRSWRDYYPGRASIEVLGWDVYNHAYAKGDYTPASTMFARVIEVSRAEGLPFGIAETGSQLAVGDTGAKRAAWLRDLAANLTANGALFVDYFDVDKSDHGEADFRIRDAASMAAWREFCG